MELQAFQQTDNGHLIAKGLWSKVPGIEYEIEGWKDSGGRNLLMGRIQLEDLKTKIIDSSPA